MGSKARTPSESQNMDASTKPTVVLALTILQPWTWCICHGDKRIENRTWSPRFSLPFELVIHSGVRPLGKRYRDVARAVDQLTEDGIDIPSTWSDLAPDDALDRRPYFDWSCIVAVATVTEIIERPTPIQQLSYWWAGPIGWKLDHVRVLPKPVPCRGYQGLWQMPTIVQNRVHAQLRTRESLARITDTRKS